MLRPNSIALVALTSWLAAFGARALESRSFIYIDGDGSLTAENGVVNPQAAGTPEDPYRISGWRIDDPNPGAQIFVENVSACLRIEDNRLEEAPVAILLYRVGCATVQNNVIEDIRAEGTSFGGGGKSSVGIFVESSENVTIAGNQLSDVTGGSGDFGMFGWPGGFIPGGQGGDAGHGGLANGIHVSSTDNLTIRDNDMSYLTGGSGGAGGAGGQGVPGGRGGHGGNGGDGYGIHLQNCNDVTVSGNLISKLSGAAGGAGGAGGYAGADGGNGGQGGDAVGLVLMHSRRVRLSGNRILTLYGGAAAAGAAGAWGGVGAIQGGDGGIGGVTGDAVAMLGLFCRDVTLENNTVDDLYGAAGSASGAGAKGAGMMLTPTGGGRGGSGSSGGAALALKFQNSTGIRVVANRVSDLRGGAGAVGSAGGYAGGDAGRGGNGGFCAAGMFVASSEIQTRDNLIERLSGGAGGWGAAGAAGVARGGLGGDGGPGGPALGFYLSNCSGIQVDSDSCFDLRGGAGGPGGTGGAYNLLTSMAKSGDGGRGGDAACLVFWQSPDHDRSGIQADSCTGGSGGTGAMGGGENGRDGTGDAVIVK